MVHTESVLIRLSYTCWATLGPCLGIVDHQGQSNSSIKQQLPHTTLFILLQITLASLHVGEEHNEYHRGNRCRGPCHRLQCINVAEIVLTGFPLLDVTSTRCEFGFHAVPTTTSGAPLSEVARAFSHADTRSKLSTALTADEHRIFVTLAHDHPILFPIDCRS